MMHDDIPRRPAWWCDKLFGRKVWSGQQEVVEAPFRHQFSLYHTGHGVGKTEAASMIPVLWMLSHYPTYVLILSASWPNITGKLFPSMKNKIRSIKVPQVRELIGKRLPQISRSFARWKLDEEWECIGLSPDEPEVVQGWHSEAGTLVMVDESSELPFHIFEPLLSLIKSKRDAMILFGNPIRADGPMADIIRGKPGFEHCDNGGIWNVKNIPTTDSPNYVATQRAIDRKEITQEEAESGEKEIIVVNGLQTYSWVKRQIRMEGEGSAYVESRVYGRLPEQSPDTYIPRYMVMACADREMPSKPGPRVLLVIDPAWSEQGDPMVFLIYDPTHDAILHAEDHIGMLKPAAMRRTRELCEQFPVYRMRIDEAGYGAAMVQDLQEENYSVEGINYSRSPHDPSRYAGCRDESYALGKQGLDTLAIPEHLISRFEEMSQIKFSEATGRLKIEDKKKFKSRGNKSPGYADCWSMIYTRLPGDPAFPHAGSTLKSMMEPTVWREEVHLGMEGPVEGGHEWMIRFKEIHPTIVRPRSGYLLRSMWYSRRETSGAVWVHVDEVGCWTVFDSYKGNFLSLSEFARQVHMRSFSDDAPHDYAFDCLSAPTGAERLGKVHMISTFHEELMNRGNDTTPLPSFSPASDISGMAGFEVLDRMILAYLAHFPEDDYWDVTGRKPRDYTKDEMLVVWPQNVVEELTHARLRQPTSWKRDVEEDKPQEAVGGGGPLVRALRLLAVSGAGIQVGRG